MQLITFRVLVILFIQHFLIASNITTFCISSQALTIQPFDPLLQLLFRSNLNRIDFNRFYMFVLEEDDAIIAAASIRYFFYVH